MPVIMKCLCSLHQMPVSTHAGHGRVACVREVMQTVYHLADKQYHAAKLPPHIFLVNIVGIFHLSPLLRLM